MPPSGAHRRWALLAALIVVSAALAALWPAADPPLASAPVAHDGTVAPVRADAGAGVVPAGVAMLPPDVARNPFGGADWADATTSRIRLPSSPASLAGAADTALPAHPAEAAPAAPGTRQDAAASPAVAPPAHVDGDNAPGVGHEPAPPPAPE